jgi:hypothetical protein
MELHMETNRAQGELEEAIKAFLARGAEGGSAPDDPTGRLLLALVEENRRLRAGLEELARRHERLAVLVSDTSSARWGGQRPPAPPPRVERPLSYWAANVPAYDQADAPGADEAARYLARPRVDPASVVLTEEDLARQPSPHKRYLRDHGLPQSHYLWSSLAVAVVLLVLIALAFVSQL